MRLEHGRQGLGLQHQVLLACVHLLKCGDVAGDVRCSGVDAAAARGRDLAVGDRLQAAGAKHVPGGQAGADALGADEVGVLHPQRFEDALAQVMLERLAADVLDDLSERGEPVVAVDPLGSRLNLDRQAPAVVLGERRRARSPRPDAGADARLPQIREPAPVADPGGVGQEVADSGPKLSLAGTSRKVRR